ncbi:hypothetical protein QQ045_011902 [Rhodiola kirilowii]
MELVNQRIQVAERKQKQMVTFLFKLVIFHNFHYFRVPASLLLLSDMYFISLFLSLCVFSEMALQQSASLKWLFCSSVKKCSLIPIQTPLATAAILPILQNHFLLKKF